MKKLSFILAILFCSLSAVAQNAGTDRNSPGQANLQQAEQFLQENKNAPGVQVTSTGLQYKVIQSGKGNSPVATSKVVCHYEGTLLNGNKFDSSYDRNEPAEFPVNGVIMGWQEILPLMKEGDIFEVWIHPNLAYGERGAGGLIGPNELLKFKIELITVK